MLIADNFIVVLLMLVSLQAIFMPETYVFVIRLFIQIGVLDLCLQMPFNWQIMIDVMNAEYPTPRGFL